MRFFNIDVEIDDSSFWKDDKKTEAKQETKQKIRQAANEFMEETVGTEGCVFMPSVAAPHLVACVCDDKIDEFEFANKFMKRLGFSYALIDSNEITLRTFFDEVEDADRYGLLRSKYGVMAKMGMGELFEKREFYNLFVDRMADEDKSADELIAEAKEKYLGCRYEAELNRILSAEKSERFIGIPAHYIIGSTDNEHRRTMIRNIIAALHKQGRLLSRRYTLVALGEGRGAKWILPEIYAANEGATVLLKIESDEVDEDGFKRNIDIDEVCEFVKENCSSVLTIFSINSRFEKIKEKIKNALSGVAVVDISEDLYAKDQAVAIMQSFAQKDGVEFDLNMQERMRNSERSYDFKTLASTYAKWRHEYLSTTAFPEYKSFFTQEAEEEEKKSDAYVELQSMIGLTPVKKLIDDAVNYFKLQKEYRRRGIEFHRPAMHMVFTGSPGTAKTSVARLVARIFKDNGILSVGNLIEVGRGDIIGQYVGQTAPLVKSFFKKAKGSILFIDEAYSLVDDKKGMYGDEAINTIVQEMENNRDDLIVIFAGYKDEMETFLERNPGLNSRIAFHVPFDDYSDTELLNITKLLAKKSGFSIEASAEEKLLSIFDAAKSDLTFGNGRFARNLFEKAKLALSNRITKLDLRFVSDNELTTLTAADFEYTAKQPPCRRIGFSV